MSRILVVGLNPAWQQVFTLPGTATLRTGAVNRAAGCLSLASGKGFNAAKVLAGHGHEVSLLQVLAGELGNRCAAACEARGIRSLDVRTDGETRVCVTLLHEGMATEIVGSFSVTEPRLRDRLLDALPPARSQDAVLICGSVPEGVDSHIYGDIIARVAAPLVVWDSVMNLTPGVLARVTWLKVNAEEHRALTPLLADAPAGPSLLITNGAEPASVRTPDGAWTCALPRIEALVNPAGDPTRINPIGAGDTATALLADGLLRGLDAKAAVGRALAGASASCLDVRPAAWDPAVAARLEADIRWTAA